MENKLEDYRVLVVDDDPSVHANLSEVFVKNGLHMASAFDGSQATDMLTRTRPDIVVLDIAMPGKDGLQVLREIRADSDLPVIMLTAKGEEFDRLLGLELGADDYIVKPYSAKEVAARIRTVLRRLGKRNYKDERDLVLCVGNLEIDKKAYQIRLNGEVVPCTSKEIDILWTLASNEGVVFTREHLLQAVWSYEYVGDTRAVDSHIKRIRAKLSSKNNTWDIRTVWGVGYRFESL